MKTLARAADQAEVLARLRALRWDSRRRWGRMSVGQMLCHLADAFRIAKGERAVSHDTHLLNRTLVKWIALYLPLPWPAGIMTRPEIDQLGAGTKPTDFAADRNEAERQLEDFVIAAPRLHGMPHPIFGPLSTAAWLRWGYLHTDHHLRQFGA